MQAPTPEQITYIQRLMNYADNDRILLFLQQNPTVDVNNIRKPQSENTLYMEVMFDARTTVDSPLFIEVLRRNPDPFLKNRFGDTALDQVRNRYYQFRDQRFLDKYRVAKRLEDSIIKSKARNLSALMLSGKNALGQLPNSSSSSSAAPTTSSSNTSSSSAAPTTSSSNTSSSSTTTTTSSSSAAPPRRIPIPQNAQNIITEFLTGIKGPTATKMSQLRVKAGLPGVSSGTQGGSRKNKARKIKSRSSKKKKTFKRK